MKLKVIFIYFYLFLFIFSFSLVCSKNVLEPIDLSSELGLSENIVGYDINCVKTETSVLKNYLITFKSNSSYLDLNGNFFEDIKPSLKERNSFLRLNEEGNILEADFISTGGNYTINGIKFNTPKNSRVLYNNEKGIILEGINSNFLSPIFSLGTSEKITFKGKNVILPNNEFLESGEIKFNGKNYYVEKGDDFKIKGVNVMGVSSNKNIYFDGKDYGENSISFGETNLIAKSGDNLNFKFDKNNPYSKVEENDYFGIDLNKNSEFNLEKQEDFSDLKVKGENLVVHQGRKDIIYDGNQIYVQNIKSRIGQGTSPLKLSFDNSDILKEKEIWIDDYGAISIMDVDLNENDFFNGEDSSKNVGINEVCAPMNKGLMQSSIVEFEGEKYYIDPVEYIKAMEKYEKDYSNYEWELGLRDLDKQILMTSDSNSKYFDYSGVELFDKFKKTFNDEQDLQDYLDKCWKLDSKIVQKRIDKASEEFIQDYEFVKFYYIDKGEKIYPSREVVSWFFSMSKEGYDENFKVNTFNKLNFPLNFEKPFFLLKDKVSGKIVLVELENLQKLKSSFIKKYPECVSSILIRSTSSYAVLQEDFLNNYDPIYHELDDLIELSSAECDLKAIQFYFENTFSYHGRKYNSYLKSIEEMVKEMGKKTSWEKIKNSFKLPKGGEIKEGIVEFFTWKKIEENIELENGMEEKNILMKVTGNFLKISSYVVENSIFVVNEKDCSYVELFGNSYFNIKESKTSIYPPKKPYDVLPMSKIPINVLPEEELEDSGIRGFVNQDKLGTFYVHGREIPYYNIYQEEDYEKRFCNGKCSKDVRGNYYRSRCKEPTRGWNNKGILSDKEGVEIFYEGRPFLNEKDNYDDELELIAEDL